MNEYKLQCAVQMDKSKIQIQIAGTTADTKSGQGKVAQACFVCLQTTWVLINFC